MIRFPHYRRHKGGERSSSHAALPHCPQPNFTQLSILPHQPSFYIHTFCSSFSLLFIIFSARPFLRGQIARITSARRTRRVPAFGYTAVPTLHLCTVLTQETLSCCTVVHSCVQLCDAVRHGVLEKSLREVQSRNTAARPPVWISVSANLTQFNHKIFNQD